MGRNRSVLAIRDFAKTRMAAALPDHSFYRPARSILIVGIGLAYALVTSHVHLTP